jgi:hypothetical protein
MNQPPTSPSQTAWPWRNRPSGAGDAAAARRRGVVRAAIGLLAALLLWLWKPLLALVVVTISLLALALALLSPLAGFARLERFIDRFAHLVGQAVTWLLMPLLFVLVVLPAGLVLRRGRLRFTGNPDATLPTYWQRRAATPGEPQGWQRGKLDSYRRQF